MVFAFIFFSVLTLAMVYMEWLNHPHLQAVNGFRVRFSRPSIPSVNRYKDDWVQIAAAAIPLIASAIQAGVAKKKDVRRPIYDVPQAEKEALANEKRLGAMEDAPGTDALLNQIRQSGAGATQSIKELSGGNQDAAAGVTNLYAQELDALQGLQGRQEQFRVNQQNTLNRALSRYGGFQDKQFDYNINQPYQNNAAAKSALTNSAISNFYTGAMNVAGAYGQKQQSQEYLDFIKQLYGQQGAPKSAAPGINVDGGVTAPGGYAPANFQDFDFYESMISPQFSNNQNFETIGG